MQQKAVWRGTRPFRPCAGDIIQQVLLSVKGRVIARLVSYPFTAPAVVAVESGWELIKVRGHNHVLYVVV